jgi:2-phosphosulfolactate phosphatase
VTWFSQQHYGVRFEWGPVGAQQVTPSVAALVVVDVLSFTTSVDVAVTRGTAVFPFRWRDERAAAFARSLGAELAVGRSAAAPATPWSLSPRALRDAPFTRRLVLPSPNGSSIAAAAAGLPVVAGSLRNARAVGRWLRISGYGTPERPVLVVASGEKWPDGSLRPALEDLLGAGAVIAALDSESLSPEAFACAAAYTDVGDVAAAVRACASGQELITSGYAADVEIAVATDASETVPLLRDGAFRSSANFADR